MLNVVASCRTKQCHAELDSASLVQGRSRIKFGMTDISARDDGSGMFRDDGSSRLGDDLMLNNNH